MVSMQVVRTLLEAIVQAGVSESWFLRAAKLDRAQLERVDARFPRSQLYALFDCALELTRDPAFGLHSIERMTSDALNPIAGLVSHAATLRQALAAIQEFRSLLGDEPSFRVYEADGQVLVKANVLSDEPLRVRRYMAEVTVAGLFRTIRRFRSDAQVDYVAFDYSAPDYRHEYTRVFEGRARFEQTFTGVSFDARLMAATAPHPDAELHRALEAFAQHRARQRANGVPYALRVHEFLVWQRSPRDLTMQATARALGTSERSLRRHLQAEGESYASLVNAALATLAKRCLLDERCTIHETALELGFADNTGFHRAFKRWTGLTPAEFRRQHAEGAGAEPGKGSNA